VLALGLALVVLALLLLADGIAVAARHPDEILTGPSLTLLGLNWLLPSSWVGATGIGLIRGRGWARGSFFALSALALVVLAGLISRGAETPEQRVRMGVMITIGLICAAGSWYLLGGKGRDWFKAR
jgi:hypothetical protein